MLASSRWGWGVFTEILMFTLAPVLELLSVSSGRQHGNETSCKCRVRVRQPELEASAPIRSDGT